MYGKEISFVLLVWFSRVYSYNFDTNNPIVYEDPQRTNNSIRSNYFGYTVVLFPGSEKVDTKWIYIGAPRGQDPGIQNFKNTGVVYNCPYIGGCTALNISQGVPYPTSDILSNSWIGGAMDVNYKFSRLSICAFRTTKEEEKSYLALGACYLHHLNPDEAKCNKRIVPLAIKGKAIQLQQQGPVYDYGQGEAGFSAHFPINENHLIMGAPGVRNWAGTIIDAKNPKGSRCISSKNEHIDIVDPTSSKEHGIWDYLGYAVTSGYFYGNNKLYYVSGAPKYISYNGKVIIFQIEKRKKAMKIQEVKVGRQFGEYFGSSLAAGDINNDGFDDLIIGAPFHKGDTYNEGRIQTFLGKNKSIQLSVELVGQSSGGQFGSAIMFLGDIDQDGYGDVAVGAPYEEEFSGVLYIYKGNRQGLDKKYSQRIVGKHISSEIRGFGISISRPADMDGNGYKDIAVGAYLSGNAVLLRSRPIIVIQYSMKSIPKVLKHGADKFVLEICFWHTHYNDTLEIGLNRSVVIDSSNVIVDEAVKIVKLSGPRTVCENVTAVFVEKSILYEARIKAYLSYELIQLPQKKEVIYISDKVLNGTDIFCVRCPVLDKTRSRESSYIEIPFTVDCGPDNICQAQLSIDAKISDLKQGNVFVVGSSDYVNLDVTVSNTGENAYATQLEIMLPSIIFFRQFPVTCHKQNASTILCKVNDILRPNKKKTISLDLDMKTVNKDNYASELTILLRVTANNNKSDWTSYGINLKRMADITISGESQEQSLQFGNVTHGMPNFTQIYKIEKIGDSPLKRVLVNITVPYAIRTTNKEISFLKIYQPQGMFSGQPVVCTFPNQHEIKNIDIYETLMEVDRSIYTRRKRQTEVINNEISKKSDDIKVAGKEYQIVPTKTYFIHCNSSHVRCFSIECTLEGFEKQRIPASISIRMMFNTQAVSDLLGSKNMILYTTHGSVVIDSPSGFIQSGNRPDFADVSSVFVDETIKQTKVALWIIILSVISGLLLLVLIVYLLTKVGFFKRAKKEELENLKAAAEQQEATVETEEPLESPTINSSHEELVDETAEKLNSKKQQLRQKNH